MIARVLDVIQRALEPQIAEAGGVLAKCTDRGEAQIKAIRYLGAKWLCLQWISDADGKGERGGTVSATLRVAVVRRPALTKDRAEAALDAEEDQALLNLADTVRGLYFRLRFGAALRVSADKIRFWPQPGFLDGDQPMRMGKLSFARQFFEVSEEPDGPKAKKELLWAECEWMPALSLPALAAEGSALPDRWITTHQPPPGVV